MANLGVPDYVPRSTYRLQLTAQFGFDAARGLTGYLKQLGVTDMYLSPLFRSREASSHGYDVVDHRVIEPEFGGEAQFKLLAEELVRMKLGILLDVVPNHMGINDPHNAWWNDVLENGPSARHAPYFDIDWNPPLSKLKGNVLLPFLGKPYNEALEQQELRLERREEGFAIHYFDRAFPVSPRTWPLILQEAIAGLESKLPTDDSERMELESIATALRNLPHEALDKVSQHERYREQEVSRRRLERLTKSSSVVREALDSAIARINGTLGDQHSFDLLDKLLDAQPYRLAYWRVAADEINYRRFFDINDLAAIRAEHPPVFEETHESVFRLLERGWVTGLRIDHPDGLYDPLQYFQSLQDAYRRRMAAREGSQSKPRGLFITVEKILGTDESLPSSWPVGGTTGYEFLNQLLGLFVQREGMEPLRDSYARLSGQTAPFSEVLYRGKKEILDHAMSSELSVLAWRLHRISQQHRVSRDLTLLTLQRALLEVIACFEVYRTYVRSRDWEVSAEDHRRIMRAIRAAKLRNPAMSWQYFDFIASLLLLQDFAELTDEQRTECREFVMKFQQVTGPVAAKGLEDTAFYRWFPLAALNEVGGEPNGMGVSVEEFHRLNLRRAVDWPYSLSATCTHDAKRGEDLRMRLVVLSEIPHEWEDAVRRWRKMNDGLRGDLSGSPAPDNNDECLIYQTLLGTWPLPQLLDDQREEYVRRITTYMEKALREAKRHTSWLNPSPEYESSVTNFVRSLLDPSTSHEFMDDMTRFAQGIGGFGHLNSLGQVLLKTCSPGIPDFYQGTELWDFNLVDPDNRRPVDFERRQQMLQGLERASRENLLEASRLMVEEWPEERIKLFVTWKCLQLRNQLPDLFLQGEYLSLSSNGPAMEHTIGFARRHQGQWLAAIAPLYVKTLAARHGRESPLEVLRDGYNETAMTLPEGAPTRWRHVFTGEPINTESSRGSPEISLGSLFTQFPVALLVAE